MAVGKVSDTTFESEVLKATGPVVVDFWAEWCGPCRMIAPALEEIAGSLGEKVKIVKLNVDENPHTAAKYGIQSIPTLMIFKDGQMASRQIGAAPQQKLEQWITTAVKRPPHTICQKVSPAAGRNAGRLRWCHGLARITGRAILVDHGSCITSAIPADGSPVGRRHPDRGGMAVRTEVGRLPLSRVPRRQQDRAAVEIGSVADTLFPRT